MMKMKGDHMKALSEYPKRVFIQRTMIQIQLGIKPRYQAEIINMRTVKHKMVELAVNDNCVEAPSGYRIYRLFDATMTHEIRLKSVATMQHLKRAPAQK